MGVNRIVRNISTADPAIADAFYRGLLGMEVVMDHGWIRTYGTNGTQSPQISFASEGGSGSPVPDISIEVDDLETVLERVRDADIPIEYGPASEPWGVTRFYVRDPLGQLVNIVMHGK